jgi:squalene-hopene/tetraprenyl-beta-curcumene cyclase
MMARLSGEISPLVTEPNTASGAPSSGALDSAIASATEALLALQKPDGHFVFELEADATIPAEYVLYKHYLGEPAKAEIEAKIAAYLRRTQGEHGGWPLFHEGPFNISASVKAYFALKMIGDDPDAPHMRWARKAILEHRGAANCNVFTRFLLALFGQLPWRGVPVMPVEIMLLPCWFPFHLNKISYWALTVLVPLLVLQALKPIAANPRRINVAELFTVPPEKVRRWPRGAHHRGPWPPFFGAVDAVLRWVEPHFPAGPRKRATEKAVAFVSERLNGEDGLGAIFPAMVNAVLMFAELGVPSDRPDVAAARSAIEKLLVVKEEEAYCQPCVSPVWDSCLASHALLETGEERAADAARRALDWLRPKQVLDLKGDWAEARPNLRPGGWAFQYANPHYPDVDDTAVVVMAMDRASPLIPADERAGYEAAIARGREWIEGMQSSNGGWGAFDAENDYEYLNHIPFSDHGALLDPPTADVSARCLSMLAQLGAESKDDECARRAVDYLRNAQEPDGSWYGRWGMNYIYGTWSVLCAFNAAGVDPKAPEIKRAVEWLVSIQNADGGWGEDGESYRLDYRGYEPAPSTPSQTAWALLGLMAAGVVRHPAVERGVAYLLQRRDVNGLWPEERFNATGFPRVFYLRYHGYAKYFPLWALARYRNLTGSNAKSVIWGM